VLCAIATGTWARQSAGTPLHRPFRPSRRLAVRGVLRSPRRLAGAAWCVVSCGHSGGWPRRLTVCGVLRSLWGLPGARGVGFMVSAPSGRHASVRPGGDVPGCPRRGRARAPRASVLWTRTCEPRGDHPTAAPTPRRTWRGGTHDNPARPAFVGAPPSGSWGRPGNHRRGDGTALAQPDKPSGQPPQRGRNPHRAHLAPFRPARRGRRYGGPRGAGSLRRRRSAISVPRVCTRKVSRLCQIR
jgi:hypothetical protein